MASASTDNILDANNFKFLWVSWIGGVISVGQGNIVGSMAFMTSWIGGVISVGQGNIVGSMTFMTYTDSTPSAVNYIAFAGWNAPGSVIITYG